MVLGWFEFSFSEIVGVDVIVNVLQVVVVDFFEVNDNGVVDF